MEKIGKRLGMQNSYIVEATGKAGGLVLYWDKEINMEHCWNTERIICCKVEDSGRKARWNLLASYGPPYTNDKKTFWDLLEQRVTDSQLLWVVIGDLNEYVSTEEKWGGRNIWKKKLYLKQFIDNVGGIDLGFVGKRFTWENNQEGLASIKERIDRTMANKTWINLYPLATVKHLHTEESEHCPIFLHLDNRSKKGHRPFRFFQAWTTDTSSVEVVNRAWRLDGKGGMHCHRLTRSLFNTFKALKKWNRDSFCIVHENSKILEEELESLQNNEEDSGRQRQIREELRMHQARLESINRQKSQEYG